MTLYKSCFTAAVLFKCYNLFVIIPPSLVDLRNHRRRPEPPQGRPLRGVPSARASPQPRRPLSPGVALRPLRGAVVLHPLRGVVLHPLRGSEHARKLPNYFRSYLFELFHSVWVVFVEGLKLMSYTSQLSGHIWKSSLSLVQYNIIMTSSLILLRHTFKKKTKITRPMILHVFTYYFII